MFFAIIFIAIGIALLLNATGLFTGSFWGIFWGIVFIVIGIRFITKRGCCPMCAGAMWKTKMMGKMDNNGCDCGHEHAPKTRKQK